MAEFTTPGGAATIGLALVLILGMSAFTFLEPLLRSPGELPLEWMLVLAWLALGVALTWATPRTAASQHADI